MANLEKIEYLRERLQFCKRQHAVAELDLGPKEELKVADFLSAYRSFIDLTVNGITGHGYRRVVITGYISDAAIDNIRFDVLSYLDCKVSVAVRKYINTYGADSINIGPFGKLFIRKADSPRDAVKVEVVISIKHPK